MERDFAHATSFKQYCQPIDRSRSKFGKLAGDFLLTQRTLSDKGLASGEFNEKDLILS